MSLYPYADIRRLYQENKERPCAVSSMASALLEICPLSDYQITYTDKPIDDFPGKMSFRPKSKHALFTQAVKHLAFYILTAQLPPEWATPISKTAMSVDTEALHDIVNSLDEIKHSGALPVSAFIRMGKYMWPKDSMPYRLSQTLVLREDEIGALTALTGLLIKEINGPDHLIVNIDDIGKDTTVNNLVIDFIGDDTLYLSRLRRTYTRDVYHLLLCYVALKQSPEYQDITINHLCMIGLSDGSTRRIDVNDIDPMVLNIVHSCLYGTPF